MGNEEEIKKCKESPYYYATKYLSVNGKPFKTRLTEEEFNREFFKLEGTWVDKPKGDFVIDNADQQP